jgi:hypothetical protein
MNEETVSGDDDKQKVPDESKRIVINSITYDYLPQGKRFTFVTYIHFNIQFNQHITQILLNALFICVFNQRIKIKAICITLMQRLGYAPISKKKLINVYTCFLADYTMTEHDRCAHCAIEYSKEDDILVTIDDISIKKRYLVCLLDEDKWLDDEVSIPY